MNHRLLKSYRRMYEQCFVPIFVKDDYDTQILLQGCELASVEAAEYTLRRCDAARVLPALRKRWADKVLLVGSVLDSDTIVRQLRKAQPQLMTFGELAALEVDGFVSMLPYSDETIKTYRDSFLLIPSAATPGEALRQTAAGAHMIKLMGGDRDLRKACRAAPTHGFCPVFVTGGVTPERMPEIYRDGAVLTASGFDLILKGIEPTQLTAQLVAQRLTQFMEAARAARDEAWPQLRDAGSLTDEQWLERLPHYCPFAD